MRSLLTPLLVFLSIQLLGSSVEKHQAQKYASHFAHSCGIELKAEKKVATPLTTRDGKTTLAWVFSGAEGGFIVIAADRRISPVVTFSKYGNFLSGSELERLVIQDLTLRLENTNQQAAAAKAKIESQWRSLAKKLSQNYQQWPEAGSTSTGGWIETHWHQDAPYNAFTPVDKNSGQRSLVGCPATAMAQILNFHRETNLTRFGTEDRYYHNYMQSFWIDDAWETYNFLSFDSLNVYLENIEAKFTAQQELSDSEKAALSLAAGFACKSVYTPSVSGTFSVQQAFDAYQRFGFTNAVLLNHHYSDKEINDKMIENIKSGLPVHLATVDTNWQSGHNVICDGYREDGFFRLNMGWGGTHDNWYNLPEGFPYNLTVFEGIVADINKEEEPRYLISFTVTNQDAQPVTLAEIAIEGLDEFLITNESGQAGTEVENGTYSFIVTLQEEIVFEDEFTIDGEDKTIEIQIIHTNATSLNPHTVSVYPNPFSDGVFVNCVDFSGSITLVSPDGRAVKTLTLDSPMHEPTFISFSGLPAGPYIINFEGPKGQSFSRIVVKRD